MFSIGTFCSLETIQSMKTTNVEIMDIDVNTSILEQGFGLQNTQKKIPSNRYELEVALEDKVYPKTL